MNDLIKKAQEGDKESLDILVKKNMGLVHKIAKKYAQGRDKLEYEEYLQEGTIGLIRGIMMFDITRGIKFSTYVYPAIAFKIQQYKRDFHSSITYSTPRPVQENASRLIKAVDLFYTENHRYPTDLELSQIMDVSLKDIALCRNIYLGCRYMDEKIYAESRDEITLIESIPNNQDIVNTDFLCDKIVLKESLSKLTEIELKIIKLRYFQNKTQREIAEIIDENQVQVSRLEKRILKKLKNILLECDYDETSVS
ncbi:MAG: sigma-70 family RNA polymerase sigma factor [Peptostreptococcaceae bacterium]